MSRLQSSIRASDADREGTAQRLRGAWMEGRLDDDELEARLERALGSRTYGELDRLVSDLPSAHPERPRSRTMALARSTLSVAVPILAVAAIVTVLVAVALVTAAWWTMWALLWLFGCSARGCGSRRGRTLRVGAPPGLRRAARLH